MQGLLLCLCLNAQLRIDRMVNSYSKGHQAETALRWFRRSGIDVRSMRQQHLACLFSCLEALNTIMLFLMMWGFFLLCILLM